MREYGFNEPNIDILRMGECSSVPGTRKPVLLRLDDRGEVVRFYRLFAPLRDVPLVSACFVLWAERFTCRPWLEIDIRRCPKNPRTGLSLCFPSVLMCSETTAISVCQNEPRRFAGRRLWPLKCHSGNRYALLGLSQNDFIGPRGCWKWMAYFQVPFTCPWIGRPGSPVRKASANVRECPGLSRRLLKCARRCHWSFWYQEGFLKSHIGYLLTLR
ncbi:hypothetical protein CRG98_046735 [Punica granatum]|uniref:Uncharacterized protein n=1 Tax=Punica granatum TaxID=22663 RepID=A0A2I0HME3_PUNGR|nr:hypothetical protein CRG98_046735 [Punica granatum]